MELFPSVVVWAGRVGRFNGQMQSTLAVALQFLFVWFPCFFFLNLNFPPVEISTRSLVITLDGISRLCRGLMLDNIADVMISFQPLLINQPKSEKKKKKEKWEKNFLGWIRDPPPPNRNNLCLWLERVPREHFYGRHTRSLPVELLVVLGLYSHRFFFLGGGITNTQKKARKLLFLSGPLPVDVEFLSLCVCTTHTDKKQQECYTYTQTNDERLEEGGGNGIINRSRSRLERERNNKASMMTPPPSTSSWFYLFSIP